MSERERWQHINRQVTEFYYRRWYWEKFGKLPSADMQPKWTLDSKHGWRAA